MKMRWCAVTAVCGSIGLLPLPRAESKIDVVSAQLCVGASVRWCASPHVRLLRIGEALRADRRPGGVRKEDVE